VIKPPLALILLYVASAAFADGYDRKDFNYRSYKPNTSIGFYTGQPCDFINIEIMWSASRTPMTVEEPLGAHPSKTPSS
jgi:hypothetical protein